MPGRDRFVHDIHPKIWDPLDLVLRREILVFVRCLVEECPDEQVAVVKGET